MDSEFWKTLQQLVDKSDIEIDRPQGSQHPRYPDYVYPFDYGFLKGTTSSDGADIDCWIGSEGGKEISGAILIVDLVKRDSEIKVLCGCTPADMDSILKCHQRGSMEAMLVIKQ